MAHNNERKQKVSPSHLRCRKRCQLTLQLISRVQSCFTVKGQGLYRGRGTFFQRQAPNLWRVQFASPGAALRKAATVNGMCAICRCSWDATQKLSENPATKSSPALHHRTQGLVMHEYHPPAPCTAQKPRPCCTDLIPPQMEGKAASPFVVVFYINAEAIAGEAGVGVGWGGWGHGDGAPGCCQSSCISYILHLLQPAQSYKPHFPSIGTAKNHASKKSKKNVGNTGLPCLDKRMLVQGWGWGIQSDTLSVSLSLSLSLPPPPLCSLKYTPAPNWVSNTADRGHPHSTHQSQVN